jgi:hypothetical protein
VTAEEYREFWRARERKWAAMPPIDDRSVAAREELSLFDLVDRLLAPYYDAHIAPEGAKHSGTPNHETRPNVAPSELS